MTKSLVLILVNIWLAPAFAQSNSEVDVRSMAKDELNRMSVQETHKQEIKKQPKNKVTDPALNEPGQTPSIMLPLHDPYEPVSSRSWQWKVDVGMSTQKIEVTKPDFVLGRESLSELGTLPFVNFNFGFAMPHSWGFWGASMIGATTVKSEDVPTAAGPNIKSNIQYISYGVEPAISRRWSSWFGNTAALQYELVSVAQTSAQSDFARWSRNFTSTNWRLGFDGYISEKQIATLSLLEKYSSYGRTQAVQLSYGVRW